MRKSLTHTHTHVVSALVLLATLALACATPVGVDPASQREVDLQLSGNVLNSDQPSSLSREYLQRLALADMYDEKPREALEILRSGLGGPDERTRLFALAELWFGAAQKSGDRSEYLAAAVCAYAALFPREGALSPTLYDGTLRLALDLYNRGLVEGLRSADGKDGTEVDLTPRTLPLPFGTFELQPPDSEFRYGGYRVTHLMSLADEKVRGLRNRYRRAGIGAALVARVEPAPGSEGDPWLPRNAKVPITAFVRLSDPAPSIARGAVSGKLEVYDADDVPAVPISQRTVPLESEPSAALAYRLESSSVWDFEIAGFRRPDFRVLGSDKTKGLFFLNPYRPGRIPVVFVHGTASSPARWAEMANELLGDPHIASHFQLWFFIYNSGQPVLLSAANLRDALNQVLKTFDPEGTNPELHQMVVVGHSQGGLLTKSTVVTSGNAFWSNFSDAPFESVDVVADLKRQMRDALFFDALPFVTRVVFISTPHRGSYLAENWLGMLARRLVNTPATLSKLSLEIAQLQLRNPQLLRSRWRPQTSIDNMDWSNPALRTLYSLPIAPWVHVHSIIPITSEPKETADDGVVKYQSAHIEPVESELVIYPSGHSTQATPQAIEEVRRILYEHANIK
jgi:pimeloyl-ACP methyl ester carboxylesterase